MCTGGTVGGVCLPARLCVAAILVGEALMTAPDVGAKVRELFDGIW